MTLLALENLRKARERMAAFIRTTTRTNIAEATLIRGTLVIGGSWPEITVCAAYFADILEIEGMSVDEVDADDPDYTFLRVPEGALEAALAKHLARR